MAPFDDFRALQFWSDTWWSPRGPDCACDHVEQGPRYHAPGCPWLAWAWELKARDLLRGGGPGDDPAGHLAPLREVG